MHYLQNQSISESSWNPDYWPTDEWQTSTPNELRMQNRNIEKMDDYIEASDWNYYLDSLLVVLTCFQQSLTMFLELELQIYRKFIIQSIRDF